MKADWCNIPVSMSWKGSEHFIELLKWLDSNIDKRDWDWDVVRDDNKDHHRIYYFAHERDAVEFSLRWLK